MQAEVQYKRFIYSNCLSSCLVGSIVLTNRIKQHRWKSPGKQFLRPIWLY